MYIICKTRTFYVYNNDDNNVDVRNTHGRARVTTYLYRFRRHRFTTTTTTTTLTPCRARRPCGFSTRFCTRNTCNTPRTKTSASRRTRTANVAWRHATLCSSCRTGSGTRNVRRPSQTRVCSACSVPRHGRPSLNGHENRKTRTRIIQRANGNAR